MILQKNKKGYDFWSWWENKLLKEGKEIPVDYLNYECKFGCRCTLDLVDVFSRVQKKILVKKLLKEHYRILHGLR